MLRNEFFTKRNQSIIERFNQLKTDNPKTKKPELIKQISEEMAKKGDPLSVSTIESILYNKNYMPYTKKQSA